LVLINEDEIVDEEFRSKPRDYKKLLPGEKAFLKYISKITPFFVICIISVLFRCLGDLSRSCASLDYWPGREEKEN
jgi:hypothetical protein